MFLLANLLVLAYPLLYGYKIIRRKNPIVDAYGNYPVLTSQGFFLSGALRAAVCNQSFGPIETAFIRQSTSLISKIIIGLQVILAVDRVG